MNKEDRIEIEENSSDSSLIRSHVEEVMVAGRVKEMIPGSGLASERIFTKPRDITAIYLESFYTK